MTQSSGFINGPEDLFPQNEEADGELGAAPQGYRVGQPAKRMLTSTQAKELMDRRHVLAQDHHTQKDVDTDEPDGQGDEELSDGSQSQDATNEGSDKSNLPSSHTWGRNSLDGENDALDDSEDVHAAGPGMGRTWNFDAGVVSGSDRDASLDNGEHGQKRARTSVVSSHDQDPDGLRVE
ncbi:hypothetical protein L210DRAFT_3656683 [Boletus edulis BED1]|uniref:Uncharacterized protein n=1 Tax=Boletus edulis BED1 TaxID=1328754 RepID=A0AAD4BBW9_BOLED|nr:hypothetical protein L210DRAFT_3656683 [Boletus edulis BED1]